MRSWSVHRSCAMDKTHLLDRLGAKDAPLALEEQVKAAYDKRLKDFLEKA